MARSASQGTMLGWHQRQLSARHPTGKLMGSHVTPWGTSSSLETLPELCATYVPAGLRSTSPCTPRISAHPKILPQARGGPRDSHGPEQPPSRPQSPPPAHQPLQPYRSHQALPNSFSHSVGQSRTPNLAPHSRRYFKRTCRGHQVGDVREGFPLSNTPVPPSWWDHPQHPFPLPAIRDYGVWAQRVPL